MTIIILFFLGFLVVMAWLIFWVAPASALVREQETLAKAQAERLEAFVTERMRREAEAPVLGDQAVYWKLLEEVQKLREVIEGIALAD